MADAGVCLKILVIEDDRDIRETISTCLVEVGGFQTVEADGGQEGLRLALAEKPDVILLDVMMPTMDGPTTLACLQAEPRTGGIPVIFLTAKALTSEVNRLKELGAKGVLVKPFDPLQLPSQIEEILAGGGQ